MYACLAKDGTAPLIHANKGMFGNFTVLNPLEALAGKLSGLNIPLFVLFQIYVVAALVIIVFATGDRDERKEHASNSLSTRGQMLTFTQFT